MGRILVLAMNDLRLTLKDRPALFWAVIMPIAFIYIFGSMHTGGGSPSVGLAVVDQDESFLSKAFVAQLSEEGFNVAAVSDSIARIDWPRFIQIPVGFQDSIALAHQVPVRFGLKADANAEYSQTARMHIVRAVIKMVVDLVETTKRRGVTLDADVPAGGSDGGLSGALAKLREAFTGGSSGGAPIAIDADFERTFAEVAAEPPTITMQARSAGRGRPVPTGRSMSLPAMITLFMLINTGMYGAIYLTEEKQTRVLSRIATYPLTRTGILTGKLLGRTLIGLLQAAILLVAGRFLFGAFLGNSLPALLLLILCWAVTVGAHALFWGAVLKRVEQATAVVMIVSLFLGAIGGCWWPLEVVPPWMRTFGHISPAAWAMDGFHALISFGETGLAILMPCLILLAYATAFTIAGACLLKYSD